MTEICTHEAVLRNVKVPLSLLARPERFGDQRDQDCLSGDLVIRAGKAVGLTAASEAEAPARLVLPRLTECHVHLDKCHTISRMEGVGGDLIAAIEAQAADRQYWTADDIRARAARGLDELISAGCGAIRSHVDWGAEISPLAPAPAWQVLCELVQEYQNKATVQLAVVLAKVETVIFKVPVHIDSMAVFFGDFELRNTAIEFIRLDAMIFFEPHD